MVVRLSLMVVSSLITLCLSARAEEAEQTPKDRDREAILAMAGTFVVDFNFKETVPFEQGYQMKEPYHSSALEVVIVDEETENKIVLQHILQSDTGRLTKHWRQDWEFENTVIWEFQGDNVWTKRELTPEEAKGTWTQRVYQVDDSPRYEAIGKWVHLGNLSEWQSAETFRPLPRREHTTRSDYNILVGTNRHALTQTGWVHEQDNTKLQRKDGKDTVLVREFGLNRYDRTLESRASKARQWWRDNRDFWMDVRAKWADVFQKNTQITLLEAVEDGPLHEHLFALCIDAEKEEKYSSEAYNPKIAEWVDRFLEPQTEATQVDKKD